VRRSQSGIGTRAANPLHSTLLLPPHLLSHDVSSKKFITNYSQNFFTRCSASLARDLVGRGRWEEQDLQSTASTFLDSTSIACHAKSSCRSIDRRTLSFSSVLLRRVRDLIVHMRAKRSPKRDQIISLKLPLVDQSV
jgi:hypothetical protein